MSVFVIAVVGGLERKSFIDEKTNFVVSSVVILSLVITTYATAFVLFKRHLSR